MSQTATVTVATDKTPERRPLVSSVFIIRRRKKVPKGDPFKGRASCQSNHTLRLAVKWRSRNWEEAQEELNRRGVPVELPELLSSKVEISEPIVRIDEPALTDEEVAEHTIKVEEPTIINIPDEEVIAMLAVEDSTETTKNNQKECEETPGLLLKEALLHAGNFKDLLEDLIKGLAGHETITKEIKKILNAVIRLRFYLLGCHEIPTAKQRRDIRGRLERIERNIQNLLNSPEVAMLEDAGLKFDLGCLPGNLRPFWDYISQ